MKLKNSIDFFKSLQNETTKKGEGKIYKEFVQILNNIEKLTLSQGEIATIQLQLDALTLTVETADRKKYYSKKLVEFKAFLLTEFSLSTKEYYTNRYGGLGVVFGLLFGVAILSNFERSMSVSLGLVAGMVIGALVGRQKDAQAAAAGKVV